MQDINMTEEHGIIILLLLPQWYFWQRSLILNYSVEYGNSRNRYKTIMDRCFGQCGVLWTGKSDTDRDHRQK